MSLKNVVLDPFLIAQLYPSSLIPDEGLNPTKDSAKISFLGNNRKNIALLIHNEREAWLPDDLYTFLSKILLACGLNMDDVALINPHSSPAITASELKEQLKPEKVIFFGDFFEQWIGKNRDKNKVLRLEGYAGLFTDDLAYLQHDKQAKKEFWKALQSLFNLKK